MFTLAAVLKVLFLYFLHMSTDRDALGATIAGVGGLIGMLTEDSERRRLKKKMRAIDRETEQFAVDQRNLKIANNLSSQLNLVGMQTAQNIITGRSDLSSVYNNRSIGSSNSSTGLAV